MRKVNVLHLITGAGVGGAEKSVLAIAKYINKTKFNTFVLALAKRDELLEEFLSNDINITILNKTNSLSGFIQIFKSVIEFSKKNKIEIIHAHMTHSIIVASFVKLLIPSVKIVYTSHTLNIGSKLREFAVWSLKYLRDIDIIFSREILKYFYKRNYKIIPNGIKVENYKLNFKKNKKFTFITVGRLETVKNQKVLLEIIKDLKGKFEFEIHIIGVGYLRGELESLIKKYNLDANVKLLGLRNDIPKCLNKAHCFVLPSLWEGLPIVLLEAGASCLPIISTPVGSIPTLIDNEMGYLSEVDNFANTMEYVFNNYEESMEKANLLKNHIVDNFSIEQVVKEHENIYKDLIKT